MGKRSRGKGNGRRRVSAFMVVRRDGSKRAPRRSAANGSSASLVFPVVIEFARGSATPRIESLNELHRCGRWLAKRRDERVTVVGHANARGWKEAAAVLARYRVDAVTDLLILLGARPDQLVPISTPRLHSVRLGSTRGERQRRRVVVIFRHEPPQGALRKPVRRALG